MHTQSTIQVLQVTSAEKKKQKQRKTHIKNNNIKAAMLSFHNLLLNCFRGWNKNVFAFSKGSQQWHGANSWNLSSCKTRTHLSYTVDINNTCKVSVCSSGRVVYVSVILMMTSSNGNIFRVTGPLCGEFTGPGEFPTQRPVTRSFDVYFDLRPNKRLSKQSWGWWFETL